MEYQLRDAVYHIWHDADRLDAGMPADERFAGSEEQLLSEMAGRVDPCRCNEFVPPSEEVAEADRKAAAKLLPDDTPVTMEILKALGYV
tara:strand:+ start:664 stop:930 length:267 start_codon:yes stop_codon:yes gene_type:complete